MWATPMMYIHRLRIAEHTVWGLESFPNAVVIGVCNSVSMVVSLSFVTFSDRLFKDTDTN
jgi:hypothetical protein